MKERIIQFGEGNFLRGFADYFIHCLNKKGLYDGKVVLVQPIPVGQIEGLRAQDFRYNLYLRGIDKGETVTEHSLIESVARGVDPYISFDEYMALADNPDFRFVISNTTESGIAFDGSCRPDDRPCKSFPGKLTQLLYRRWKNGMDGFVHFACELIDNNGDELKKCVLRYAELWQLEKEFVCWLEEKNAFVNTLVDRIVTGYPGAEQAKELAPDDNYVDTAEIFHLWVIEGNYEDELPLRKAGFNVVWTDDAKPYKKIKVRVLNGAHTSLVAGAILSGIETVGEAMADEKACAFLMKCIKEEILPTIGENEDSIAFAESVLDRFRNPFIKHKWRSIALNSVSKFAVRDLPTLLEYKEKFGTYPRLLTMALAYLIYFYKNDTPDDAADVTAKMKNGTIAEILSDCSLWQNDLSGMTDIITEYCGIIENKGAEGAMEWILSE
ncbi:MAG: tagaturonate reductase [Ruminococcaceae bacterium]|nr:tagaturonate reductase [Oscillospiraceae bacterium]